MTLCSIGVVARHYGVSPSTIRRWAGKGLLTVARRTLGGHRRFELDNSCASGDTDGRKHVGYARVSSYDQKEDLQRQAERLKTSGCEEVITDIGSGLNCNKPGLRTLLNRISQSDSARQDSYAVRCLRRSTAALRHRFNPIDVPQSGDRCSNPRKQTCAKL